MSGVIIADMLFYGLFACGCNIQVGFICSTQSWTFLTRKLFIRIVWILLLEPQIVTTYSKFPNRGNNLSNVLFLILWDFLDGNSLLLFSKKNKLVFPSNDFCPSNLHVSPAI